MSPAFGSPGALRPARFRAFRTLPVGAAGSPLWCGRAPAFRRCFADDTESQAGDNPQVIEAAHDRVMPVVVAGVLTMSAAQLLDLATFMTMVRQLGPAAELNPLVSSLYLLYGYPAVAIAKVALLALVTAISTILIARNSRPRMARGLIALGILVGLVGGLSNAIAIGAI